MVTAVLCSCWKRAQVPLVSVPKAHLESAPKLVPHLLPWKLQHKHLHSERALQSKCAMSSERWSSEAVGQPANTVVWRISACLSSSCNTTVSRSHLLGTRPVFADLTAGLLIVPKLWLHFLWGFLTFRCCLEQVANTRHLFCQDH